MDYSGCQVLKLINSTTMQIRHVCPQLEQASQEHMTKLNLYISSLKEQIMYNKLDPFCQNKAYWIHISKAIRIVHLEISNSITNVINQY